MVGVHQNLNGSRDLTTPFHGWFAIWNLARWCNFFILCIPAVVAAM